MKLIISCVITILYELAHKKTCRRLVIPFPCIITCRKNERLYLIWRKTEIIIIKAVMIPGIPEDKAVDFEMIRHLKPGTVDAEYL